MKIIHIEQASQTRGQAVEMSNPLPLRTENQIPLFNERQYEKSEKNMDDFINDLKRKTFGNRTILTKELSPLTQALGFDMFLPYGEKVFIDGTKKTIFLCNYNSRKNGSKCPFYLEFHTDVKGKNIV